MQTSEAKDKVEGALNYNFDEPEEETTFQVPRLDDLCVRLLAENLNRFPALDHMKSEYITSTIELVNTKKISYSMAAQYIKNEVFWQKSALERWPNRPHVISEHGMSWRRLYAEYHISEQFERYYPSKCGTNLNSLVHEVGYAKPFVQTIKFRQLRAEINLSRVLGDFQNLQTLDLTYGNRETGMGYEKSTFGMKIKDALSLSRLIANSRSLTRIMLRENLLNDEAIQVLTSGMSRNNTITFLDLSHNRIGDLGAQCIAKLLARGSILIDLNLGDNAIKKSGALYLSHALSQNDVLGSLSMRQNQITDEGGAAILKALMMNSSLSELDLGANRLGDQTGEALLKTLTRNKTLSTINLSVNKVVTDHKGKALIVALKKI
ncbi:hypothetical protein AAMO2058_001168100 [Amorphochlora amoebiformis]